MFCKTNLKSTNVKGLTFGIRRSISLENPYVRVLQGTTSLAFNIFTFILINCTLVPDVNVDVFRDIEEVSFLLCSAILIRELKAGYLFLRTCITLL